MAKKQIKIVNWIMLLSFEWIDDLNHTIVLNFSIARILHVKITYAQRSRLTLNRTLVERSGECDKFSFKLLTLIAFIYCQVINSMYIAPSLNHNRSVHNSNAHSRSFSPSRRAEWT